MKIQVKRVYDPRSDQDGQRVLVDRLWPRGLTKEAAGIDLWLRELAPSTELRQWYGHEPGKWPEFKERYFAELQARPAEVVAALSLLDDEVTLLFSSKEPALNNAFALREFLSERQASARARPE